MTLNEPKYGYSDPVVPPDLVANLKPRSTEGTEGEHLETKGGSTDWATSTFVREREKKEGQAKLPLSETRRLSLLFAKALRHNSLSVPSPLPATWEAAALQLLGLHTAVEIEAVIGWLAKDKFWSSRVISLPQLASNFSRLLLRARNEGAVPKPKGASGPRNFGYLRASLQRAGFTEAEIADEIAYQKGR